MTPRPSCRERLLERPAARAAAVTAGYLLIAAGLWLLPTRSRASRETEDAVAAGARVWRDHTCASCHAIFGLGGQTGPDLTNIVRTRGSNTVRAVIAAGRGDMPAHRLSGGDFDRLLDYLAFIESTGEYPPRTKPLAVFGRAP